MALLQARVMQLLDQLGKTAAPPWRSVVDALVSCELARQAGDDDEQFAELAQSVRTGADAAASQELLWAQLEATIALKGKTTATEMRHLLDAGALIAVDKAIAVIRMVLDVCKDTIRDKETLQLVQYRVAKLLPAADEG